MYTWARFSEEKQLDFNGYYLALQRAPVLIDPPLLSEEDAREIEALGKPRKILLTNKDHRRGAVEAREAFGCPIAVHPLDRPLVGVEIDETFEDEALIFDALRVIHLPDGKSPGECGFWWADRRLLFLGDALIGKPPGALGMLPAEKFRDRAAAKRSLERLRPLAPEGIFVGDGVSIVRDAARTLASFLDR